MSVDASAAPSPTDRNSSRRVEEKLVCAGPREPRGSSSPDRPCDRGVASSSTPASVLNPGVVRVAGRIRHLERRPALHFELARLVRKAVLIQAAAPQTLVCLLQTPSKPSHLKRLARSKRGRPAGCCARDAARSEKPAADPATPRATCRGATQRGTTIAPWRPDRITTWPIAESGPVAIPAIPHR